MATSLVNAQAGKGWTIAFATSTFNTKLDPRDLTGFNWSRDVIDVTNNNSVSTTGAVTGTSFAEVIPSLVLNPISFSFTSAIDPKSFDNTAANAFPVGFVEEVITLTAPDALCTIVFTGFISAMNWSWPMREAMVGEYTVAITGKPVVNDGVA